MNKPLPRSKFGKQFADNYDRIFGIESVDKAIGKARDAVMAELVQTCETCGTTVPIYGVHKGIELICLNDGREHRLAVKES